MRPSIRLVATGLLALCACSGSPPPAPAQPEEPAAPPLALMSATVITKSCPDVTKANARRAENAIRKLAEPCTKVPGGDARFIATLSPDGRVELDASEGDPNGGTVPTCVVRNQLSHKVILRKPCVFQVLLEERSIAAPPATPAEPATP